MKKLMKIAIGLLLIVCLLCNVAYAAESSTLTGEVSGDGVTTDPEGGESSLDVPTAANLANKPQDQVVVIAPSIGVEIEDGNTDPTDVTFTANGNDNGTIYVYQYVNGEWKLVGQGTGSSVTLPVSQSGTFAIAVSAQASPKTGESVLPYAAIVVVIAAAAAAVVIRRKAQA